MTLSTESSAAQTLLDKVKVSFSMLVRVNGKAHNIPLTKKACKSDSSDVDAGFYPIAEY